MAVVLGEKTLLDCDLVMVKGASFHAFVEWERSGEPVDLSGASAICQVRREDNGEVIADLSECWTFASDGSATFDVTPGVTGAMEPGKWPWDLMVTESGGYTTRVLAGKCQVVDPISEA